MEFLNPKKLVDEIGLQSGDKVADFGSGSGNITVFMAQAVGVQGTIYAIDVQERVLEVVQSRAEILGLNNIKTIHADLEKDSTLKSGSMDLVFISNTLFQSSSPDIMIKEAKRVLRDGGRIVVIDWQPQDTPFGPKPNHRLSPEKIKELMGREAERELKQVGDFYFGLVFRL